MRPVLFSLVLVAACERLPPTQDTASSGSTMEGATAEVRIVTWNLESLGSAGSAEYGAVRAVLARIDADVVALNEIDLFEDDDVQQLAAELGYDTVSLPMANPFGSIHNAMLTRLPARATHAWSSAVLSGDPDSNDVSRLPVGVEVDTDAGTLAVVGQHWQSGFETADEFRRVVDSIRSAEAARSTTTSRVVLCGDVNAELDDPPPATATWTAVPSGVPSGYALGQDLQGRLDASGIRNDAFAPLFDADLEPVNAKQRDGRDGTRDDSGRRLDHLFVDPSIRVLGSEVYDARDEDQDGLPLFGQAPDREATATASDHFPVFADLLLQ